MQLWFFFFLFQYFQSYDRKPEWPIVYNFALHKIINIRKFLDSLPSFGAVLYGYLWEKWKYRYIEIFIQNLITCIYTLLFLVYVTSIFKMLK